MSQSTATPPATPAAAPKDPLLDRLARVQKIVETQQRQLQVGNILTLIVGLIGICLAAGYLQYGYNEIAAVSQPEQLVEAASGMLNKHLPDARKAAQAEIKKSAPDWAARLSDRARAAIPELRTKMEDFVMARVEEYGEQTVVLTQAKVDAFIDENHDELKRGYAEMAKDPAAAKVEVNRVRELLEKQIGADMKTRAQDLLQSLEKLNSQITVLSQGKSLSEEQQLQRRVLMVAKRLQIEQADPSFGTHTTDRPVNAANPAASTDASKEKAPTDKAEEPKPESKSAAPAEGTKSAP